MISSRLHAQLDIGLAALLSGIGVLSPGVRGLAVAGAGVTAISSSLTDFEAGLVPMFDLRAHRALDAACGSALCLAGARRGGRAGLLLALAGAAQLAVAVATDDRAGCGTPDTLYRPLGVPKPVATDLWIVDGALGPNLPVRMTVIRLRNGDLVLHSPTAYDPVLRASLEQLGPIRHLVAPNSVHWLHVQAWQRAVAGTVSWAAPGLRERAQVRRAAVALTHDLGDRPPSDWADDIDQVVVRGGLGFVEVAMLHKPSRTAIFADLVQNVEARKLPWALRPLAAALGNLAPEGRAPAHLRAVMRISRPSPQCVERILTWAPERVIVAHGAPVERDAAAWLRRSLAWL